MANKKNKVKETLIKSSHYAANMVLLTLFGISIP